MKKKLLTLITASFMLAAPCLNAGLANWISDNMPVSWRLSQEYRDEIKYMKDKTDNTIPTVVFRIDHPWYKGGAINIGVDQLRFAILILNDNKDHSLGETGRNTRTIAHELTHIKNDHGLSKNNGVLACMASSSAAIVGMLTTLKRPASPRMLTSLTTLAGSLMMGSHLVNNYRKTQSLKNETEAEEGSFKILQELGYCAALKEEAQRLKNYARSSPESKRMYGGNYPTLGEYISLAEKACAACHKNANPPDRVDTPMLMRNGPKTISWYEMIFGTKS